MRKVGYDFSARRHRPAQPELHTDLAAPCRRRGGPVLVRVRALLLPGCGRVTATLEQIDAVHSMVSHYPHALALVTSAEGLQLTVQHGGPIASLLGREGGHSIDNSFGPCDPSTDWGCAT